MCGLLRMVVVSPVVDGHPLEVVGEDPESGPGLGACEVAEAGAAESEGAFEVADPGFDADAPVPHRAEGAGAFVFAAGLAWCPRTLQAGPLDAEFGQGLVVRGGAKAAVADEGARRAFRSARSPARRPGPVQGVGRVPRLTWWSTMKPRSSSATSAV